MVGEQVIQGAAVAHGDALRAGEVIFVHRRTTHFIVRADEVCRCPVDGRFEPSSVTVVDK